ncbi:hypothetical protein L486_03060 [Kwoniella mangroviensis CBS 10435]|uniref:Uncharacterized protein n=1 Tax=Kwoniella mangroviensis CBS 10435 TaxID=1331196 RepID=A0A1B9ISR0_9TREE|nr:hypothetical protein L486_03060 [Kwoniella mangroviensis CBS 10435]
MSSSLVLTPEANPPSSLPDPLQSHSRPQRSTRAAVNYSERAPDHSSVSPHSTTPTRSAAVSTRSRRSISSSLSVAERSPDKKIFSNGRRSAFSPLFDNERKEAALGLVLGEEASTEEETSEGSKATVQEEGEDEVGDDLNEDEDEEEEDGEIGSNSEEEKEGEEAEVLEPSQSPIKTNKEQVIPNEQFAPLTNSRVTRRRTVSPEKKPVEEPTTAGVIRLVFGKKRKAEGGSESTKKEAVPASVTVASEAPILAEEPQSEAINEDFREDLRKRLPRKKRKWLKKGEVDPDDPIAVARQKERHRLIDEAIEDLNKQEQLLSDNAHPQLLWLWDELERRRGLQINWLEARHEAAIGDLERLRDHELQVAKLDFRLKREELANEMIRENRHKMARTAAERTALKRQPGSMPSLRGGRGGGGWQVSTTNLLSDGEQRLVPLTRGDDPFMRRDVSRKIESLNPAEVKADLEKFEAHKVKRQHRSSTPPNIHSKPSASRSDRHSLPRPVEPQHNAKVMRYAAPPAATQRPPSIWDPPKPLMANPTHKQGVSRPRSPEHLPRYHSESVSTIGYGGRAPSRGLPFASIFKPPPEHPTSRQEAIPPHHPSSTPRPRSPPRQLPRHPMETTPSNLWPHPRQRHPWLAYGGAPPRKA